MKGISSKPTLLKLDLLQDWEIYRFQAPVFTFQPGNFTCWGSEGAKY